MIRILRVALLGGALGVAVLGGSPLMADQASGSATTAGPAPVLHLRTEHLPYKAYKGIADGDSDKSMSHRLGRELVRQAILIAARDELGVATCDETLGETVPDDAHVALVMPVERAHADGTWSVKLLSYPDGGRIWETVFDYSADGASMYADMVSRLESAARGEFVEALRELGLEAARRDSAEPVEPGAEMEALLAQVDFLAQAAAVRAAHAAIAAQGETPEWLAVLVRGYANLALLTHHHWNSSSEVFTARAWLYAQRLTASSGSSDWALWHRAYAWALGGALHHALADLDTLAERAAAESSDGDARRTAEPALSWSQLIAPYCRCDRQGLQAVGASDPSLVPWVARLRFQLAAALGQARWMWEEASRIRERCPTAYGVYADLVNHGQYDRVTRAGAEWGPRTFRERVGASLLAMPGLPPAAAELARGAAPPSDSPDALELADLFPTWTRELIERLRQASQLPAASGLSWSAVAALLDEQQFLLVAHHFAAPVHDREPELAPDVDVLLPRVSNHRYAGYIESYRHDLHTQMKEKQRTLGSIRYADPRRNMFSMFQAMNVVVTPGGTVGGEGWQVAERNYTFQGMMEYLNSWLKIEQSPPDELARQLIREMRAIAPHSDVGRLMEVLWTRDADADQLWRWESELREDPRTLVELGKRYRRAGETADARRCCEKSLALVPTQEATLELADLYREAGDEERWEELLLAFLEHDDLGLEHLPCHVRLVEGYGDRGQWRRAKPHADAAGATGTRVGLHWASFVAERLGRWRESEDWVRAESTSFPQTSGWHWYFWCRRTGRGDLPAARKVAAEYFAVRRGFTPDHQSRVGCYHLLESNVRGALDAFRRVCDAQPDFPAALMTAQLARKRGDERLRNDVLSAIRRESMRRRVMAEPAEARVIAAGLAIVELLASGDASEERLRELDALIDEVDAPHLAAFTYFVAAELNALGNEPHADQYWRRSLAAPAPHSRYTTLAGAELAKRHGTSRPDDEAADSGL